MALFTSSLVCLRLQPSRTMAQRRLSPFTGKCTCNSSDSRTPSRSVPTGRSSSSGAGRWLSSCKPQPLWSLKKTACRAGSAVAAAKGDSCGAGHRRMRRRIFTSGGPPHVNCSALEEDFCSSLPRLRRRFLLQSATTCLTWSLLDSTFSSGPWKPRVYLIGKKRKPKKKENQEWNPSQAANRLQPRKTT